jgi:hypothetical protein
LAAFEAHVENGYDVGVVQGSDGAGLAFEAAAEIGGSAGLAEDFDSHIAIKARVPGAVDFAHAAHSEQGLDLVGTEPGVRGQRHSLRAPRAGRFHLECYRNAERVSLVERP